jgi:hypoxanthine phosphoribosyltransferase
VCIAEGAARFVEALVAGMRPRGLEPEVHRVLARPTSDRDPDAVQVDPFDPEILEDRDVLVVEDVIDRGATLRAVLELVGLAETRTVRTAVLVDKRDRPAGSIVPDYAGFEVDRGVVVGYGMGLDGEFHDLDEIGIVTDGA